ncbi:MAG: acyltransferase [Dehalococcoidia bacterium]
MSHLNAPQGRKRIDEFDLLRGAAIVGVVFLHAYFTPWPEVSKSGLAVLHASHLLAHGAVPLFLFVSAYLQGAARRERLLVYLRRRSRRIWIPAAVWMLATLAYRALSDGASLGLIREFALFNISGQFYFVWLLLFFSAALTQGWRISARWLPMIVAIAFAINLVMIGWYAERESIAGYEAIFAYRNPLVWMFFPAFGYALGRQGLAELPGRIVRYAALMMALAASVYLYRGIALDTWPVSYFGVSVFLFSAGGTVVYPSLARLAMRSRMVADPLVGLSRYALAIYFVHMPFVMGFGTQEILGNGAAWSNYWALLMANFLVGLFVSLALVRETGKFSPRIADWVFGTEGERRGARSTREANEDDSPGGGTERERALEAPLAS